VQFIEVAFDHEDLVDVPWVTGPSCSARTVAMAETAAGITDCNDNEAPIPRLTIRERGQRTRPGLDGTTRLERTASMAGW
jgi:hypothetical protein